MSASKPTFENQLNVPRSKERKDSNIVRERLNSLLAAKDTGLGKVIQGLGFALTLNAQGCALFSVSRYEFQTPAWQTQRETTVEQEEAYLREVLDGLAAFPDEATATARPEGAPSAPVISGTEYAGYNTATLSRLYSTGYPSFMTNGANVDAVRLSTEVFSVRSDYGPFFRELTTGGYTTVPGAIAPSQVVILRNIFSGTDAVGQSRNLVRASSHEFGHATSPWQIAGDSRATRIHNAYDLTRIALNPNLAVPFPESSHIENPVLTVRNYHTVIEYQAEAIEEALRVRVEDGDSWRNNYARHLVITYQVSQEAAFRTADYGIGYILTHDPNYDPVRGYEIRTELTNTLAQERQQSQVQADTALQAADRVRALAEATEQSRTVQERAEQAEARWREHGVNARVEVINQIPGLIRNFKEDDTQLLVQVLGNRRTLRQLVETTTIGSGAHIESLRARRELPPGFTEGPGHQVIEAWMNFISYLHLSIDAAYQDTAEPPGIRLTNMRNQAAEYLLVLQDAQRRTHALPGQRHYADFFHWAETYAREYLTGQYIPHAHTPRTP